MSVEPWFVDDELWAVIEPMLPPWPKPHRDQEAGVLNRLHRILLSGLNAAGELDWSPACVDASHVRAKKGCRDGPVAGRQGLRRQPRTASNKPGLID